MKSPSVPCGHCQAWVPEDCYADHFMICINKPALAMTETNQPLSTHGSFVRKSQPFGTDPVRRKQVNLQDVLRYFHDALAAVGEVIKAGQQQHNTTGWDRSKSGDEANALLNHQVAVGTLDSDGQRHAAKVAWRALAQLQKELERDLGLPISIGSYYGDDTHVDKA